MWENIPLKRNISLCKRYGKKMYCYSFIRYCSNTLKRWSYSTQYIRNSHSNSKNTSTCSRKANSKLRQLILATELLIWDEALMAHSHNILAVDRMMEDMTKNDTFFGNKIIIFCGDPRQTLPVYRKVQDLLQ